MAVRAARASRRPASKAPSRARARNRPSSGGQDVFLRGRPDQNSADEAGSTGPTAVQLTRALSGTPGARGEKISACLGASEARGRLRDQPDGARWPAGSPAARRRTLNSAREPPRRTSASRSFHLLLSQLHSSICFVTNSGAGGEMGEGPIEAPVSVLGLPRIFSPAEAALILRTLGLAEITECALRARAYRRRVPCHVNGRRITFTLDDLHEIAEGQPRRPPSPAEPVAPALTARPIMRRDTSPAPSSPTHWRARGSRHTRIPREPA